MMVLLANDRIFQHDLAGLLCSEQTVTALLWRERDLQKGLCGNTQDGEEGISLPLDYLPDGNLFRYNPYYGQCHAPASRTSESQQTAYMYNRFYL